MGGIVLAGGKSTRMGSDKAMIELDGRRLLDIVVESVREVTESVVIVGGDRVGNCAIPDQFPGEGPLGGLITGLEHLGGGTHLVVACDMPFLSPPILRKLMVRVEGFEAAIPFVEGGLQPLCAAYSGAAAAPLRRAFMDGERSLMRAVRFLRAFIVAESELRGEDPKLISLMNINSGADLKRAEELVRKQ